MSIDFSGSMNEALLPTSPKYKLLCFKLENNLFCQIKNALAFNRDTCCHLVLCLRLLPFHCNTFSVVPSITTEIVKTAVPLVFHKSKLWPVL
jgi:hypothetical protein